MGWLHFFNLFLDAARGIRPSQGNTKGDTSCCPGLLHFVRNDAPSIIKK